MPPSALQTSLRSTDDAVADGGHSFEEHSRIPSVTVVSRTAAYGHLDPLLATPSKNAFLQTAVPWLKKIGAA